MLLTVNCCRHIWDSAVKAWVKQPQEQEQKNTKLS